MSSIIDVENKKAMYTPTKSVKKALFRGLFTVFAVITGVLCFFALVTYISYWIGYCVLWVVCLKFSLISIPSGNLASIPIIEMAAIGLLTFIIIVGALVWVVISLSGIINALLKLGNYQFDQEDVDEKC